MASINMKSQTKRQLEETYKHMSNYMKDEESTAELREMCKYCERYCGMEHDYKECRDMMCFKFWLAFEYLEWSNSWG